METADTDEAMRAIFDDPSYELAILDTGYRKSLNGLRVSDRQTLVRLLKTNVMMRVKPELDQFVSGLNSGGVLDAIRAHPTVFSQCFLPSAVDLTAGLCVYMLRTVSCCSDAARVTLFFCYGEVWPLYTHAEQLGIVMPLSR